MQWWKNRREDLLGYASANAPFIAYDEERFDRNLSEWGGISGVSRLILPINLCYSDYLMARAIEKDVLIGVYSRAQLARLNARGPSLGKKCGVLFCESEADAIGVRDTVFDTAVRVTQFESLPPIFHDADFFVLDKQRAVLLELSLGAAEAPLEDIEAAIEELETRIPKGYLWLNPAGRLVGPASVLVARVADVRHYETRRVLTLDVDESVHNAMVGCASNIHLFNLSAHTNMPGNEMPAMIEGLARSETPLCCVESGDFLAINLPGGVRWRKEIGLPVHYLQARAACKLDV